MAMTTTTLPAYLKANEVAELIGIPKSTLRRFTSAGKIPAHDPLMSTPRCHRWNRDNLMRWLDQRRKAGR